MNKLLPILLILAIISCSNNNNKTDFDSRLCQNATDLLSKFDTIPSINIDLFNLNNNIRSRIDSTFNSIERNKYFYFNSLVHYNNDSIRISLAYYYQKANPTKLVTIPRFILLINSKGEVYFGPDKILIDSLNKSIYNLYSNLGQEGFPESYFNIVFALQWDKDVDRLTFNKFIFQIIDGYISFVNDQSEKSFKKPICQLNKVELESIGNSFPFILNIAEYDVVNEFKVESEKDFKEVDEFEIN